MVKENTMTEQSDRPAPPSPPSPTQIRLDELIQANKELVILTRKLVDKPPVFADAGMVLGALCMAGGGLWMFWTWVQMREHHDELVRLSRKATGVYQQIELNTAATVNMTWGVVSIVTVLAIFMVALFLKR